MIGVAGCGRMGAPMLAALRHAGFDAQGVDIRPAGECGALSPHIVNGAAAFAQPLTTLITVVRDIPQTDAVLFDDQSFVTAPRLERIILCSTLSPRYVTDLRARVPGHIALIDSPMSGAQIAAEEARLSFMVGGTPQDIDTCLPLFKAMGEHIHHMGAFGAGMQAKVLNNLLAASNTAMTRLVLDWAEKAGLDERALLDLIHTSSGQNWFASHFDSIEFARDGHDPNNTIGILVKDVDSALDAAPEGSDLVLPKTVQAVIRTLRTKAR